MIDEVKIFSKTLSGEEVGDIYHTTPTNGGHCENSNAASHCGTAGGR